MAEADEASQSTVSRRSLLGGAAAATAGLAIGLGSNLVDASAKSKNQFGPAPDANEVSEGLGLTGGASLLLVTRDKVSGETYIRAFSMQTGTANSPVKFSVGLDYGINGDEIVVLSGMNTSIDSGPVVSDRSNGIPARIDMFDRRSGNLSWQATAQDRQILLGDLLGTSIAIADDHSVLYVAANYSGGGFVSLRQVTATGGSSSVQLEGATFATIGSAYAGKCCLIVGWDNGLPPSLVRIDLPLGKGIGPRVEPLAEIPVAVASSRSGDSLSLLTRTRFKRFDPSLKLISEQRLLGDEIRLPQYITDSGTTAGPWLAYGVHDAVAGDETGVALGSTDGGVASVVALPDSSYATWTVTSDDSLLASDGRSLAAIQGTSIGATSALPIMDREDLIGLIPL